MLVIYYLGSRGEAGLKNFMHAFCKANGSPGGIQSSVWERNGRVLSINVSCNISLSCLYQACQHLKENLLVFCLFFFFMALALECCSYRCASVLLAMLTTSFDPWVILSFSFSVSSSSLSSFLPSFLCFFPCCWYFRGDRWRLCLYLQTASTEERVYLSVPFSCIF